MNPETRFYSLIIFVAAVCALLSGCGGEAENSALRARTGHVVIAVDSRAESMDPRIGTSMASYRMQQLLYTPLVDQDLSGHLTGMLATGWEEIIPDNEDESVRWLFALRRDVVFSDGSPLTAEDVAYTFNSLLHPDFVSRKKAAFDAIDTVRAIDPYTVEFVLKRRHAAFLSGLPALGIIKNSSGDSSDVTTSRQEAPVGSGAFYLQGDVAAGVTRLLAHGRFFLGKPGISILDIKVVPDDTTRALEIMHGSADLVINDLTITDAVYFSSWDTLTVVHAQGLPYNYLGINHSHPILKNRNVREALALSIDTDSIIENIYGGLGRPAVSPMIPGLWETDVDFKRYSYDPARAKILLDEAGYPDPDGDGPENRFSLEFKCSNRKSSRDLATVFKSQLADVGIGLEIRSSEWQTFYMDVVNGNFALFQLRWIGIISPDFFGAIFHSTSIPGIELPPDAPQRGSLNRGRYVNPEMDALIEKAEAEQDEAARWRIYAEIQSLIYRDLPYVDLWYSDNFAVMRSDLTGLELSLNASFAYLYKVHYIQSE